MNNLLNAYKAEQQTRLNEFISGINAIETREGLNTWQYNILPKGKDTSKMGYDTLKAYLIGRKTKATDKNIQSKEKHVKEVIESGELLNITISIEWKPSKMWGSNPSAEASFSYRKDGHTIYNKVFSGSIGGCGYDKESTAIANCLNQIEQLSQLLYTKKDENYKQTEKQSELNRDIFGYGSGYGVFPSIEGGVGANCYVDIFEAIGYKFSRTASGKNFDVYTIVKI